MRVLLSGLALLLGLAGGAEAQLLSAGPNNPTTVVNDPCVVGAAWFPTGNAVSSDDLYAQVSPAGSPTQCLKATGYGFTIPSPAEINGIEVMIERRSSMAGTVTDATLQIVKAGVITGTDHADTITTWPAVDGVAIYGSDSDLWGETWTPADINNAGFGVALSAVDNAQTASVDVMQITVHYSLCAEVPPGTCKTAQKSIFIVKDKGIDNAKDKMLWKWIKGENTSQAEFGDPTVPVTGATYALCVYETGPNLIAQAVVGPNSVTWQPISTKGYKYKDPGGLEDGINKIILKGSVNNKSKAIVKGKGAALPDLVPPLNLPMTVNLVNSESGQCWTSEFTTFVNNVAGKFKAKNP